MDKNSTHFTQTIIVIGLPPNSFSASVAAGADAVMRELDAAAKEGRHARFTSPHPLPGMSARPIFIHALRLDEIVAIFEQEVEIPAELRARNAGVLLPGTGSPVR